jgi:peptidoglycan/LPS O-acetylase OafA/YrhL
MNAIQDDAGARERLDGLDFLRGLASLAVCWFHLTSFTYRTPDGSFYGWLRLSGAYGWLGVEVFFVISGFVIPHALRRAGYRIDDYPTFILKRVVRLDPPYFGSVAVILLLAFAHALYSGRPVQVEGQPVSVSQVLLHLGYANAFFGYVWLNPSFWTLAIEFQYYLLMGLLFPLVANRRRVVRLAAFVALGATSAMSAGDPLAGGVPFSDFIPRFVFLFLLGVVAFQRRTGLIGVVEYGALLAVATGGAILTVGAPAALAGLLAVAVIELYGRGRSFVSDFFGKISYSLYLLHWPLGHLTLSVLGLKLLQAEGDAARTLVILVSLGVCLVSAYLLHVLVEWPSQRWAAHLAYGQPSRRVPPSPG